MSKAASGRRPMWDRFDDATLDRLLALATRDRVCLRFREAAADPLPERCLLLRHDVDYSPPAALRMAERERSLGIAATYFLLLHSPHYNLLDPRHAELARRLAGLGHEVGLHYDARFFLAFPPGRRTALLDAELRLLGELAGEPVRSIAMHQPGLGGDDPFRDHPGLVNAYAPRLVTGVTYVSDSCRAWRDETWAMLLAERLPARLHLLLHPVNWDARDRDRTEVFRGFFEAWAAEARADWDDLMDKIARHEAVLQHEARARRPPGG